MEQFKWTPKYSVGIQSIDEQHQHFFAIANALVKIALDSNSKNEEVIEAIGNLGNYAFYHFKVEEDYFDQLHYPEATEHIAEHNEFREKIKGFFDSIHDPNINLHDLGKEAAILSGNWLYHHILLIDKKYTKYFTDKGIK